MKRGGTERGAHVLGDRGAKSGGEGRFGRRTEFFGEAHAAERQGRGLLKLARAETKALEAAAAEVENVKVFRSLGWDRSGDRRR